MCNQSIYLYYMTLQAYLYVGTLPFLNEILVL